MRKVEKKYMKSKVVDVRSGDTVKVHQKIREGSKERVQIFQGTVIRVSRKQSLSHRVLVRRISSGVGVEKSFLMHSPLVLKVEVTKRSKVRRNYLTYMRERQGKSARLTGVDFDKESVNKVEDEKAKAEEEKLHEEQKAAAEAEAADKAKEQEQLDKKAEAALSKRDDKPEKVESKVEDKKDTK